MEVLKHALVCVIACVVMATVSMGDNMDGCTWSSWGSWSNCSQSRERECIYPGPGGCKERRSIETRRCPIAHCETTTAVPITTTVTEIQATTAVPVIEVNHCKYGKMLANRTCGGGYLRRRCPYSHFCNVKTHPTDGFAVCCPKQVHGGWSAWGGYSACSKTCGEGVKTRTRNCTNPTPAYGGKGCVGSATQPATCNTGICPSQCTTGKGPGSYLPDPLDKTKYYQCGDNGRGGYTIYHRTCALGRQWPANDPQAVKCEHLTPTVAAETATCTHTGADLYKAHADSAKYIEIDGAGQHERECAPGTEFKIALCRCD